MIYIFLSDEFYRDYGKLPEIAQKSSRPYVQVAVRIDGVMYAVPMRSHIRHSHAHITDPENNCGLDFTKTVVVTKDTYILHGVKPQIRQKEFDALRGQEYRVKEELRRYIRQYKKAKKRLDVPRNRQLCQYSTLQYFEEYLDF